MLCTRRMSARIRHGEGRLKEAGVFSLAKRSAEAEQRYGVCLVHQRGRLLEAKGVS